MKKTAEAYLSKDVTHAVVTVPAYINAAQRAATKVIFATRRYEYKGLTHISGCWKARKTFSFSIWAVVPSMYPS